MFINYDTFLKQNAEKIFTTLIATENNPVNSLKTKYSEKIIMYTFKFKYCTS